MSRALDRDVATPIWWERLCQCFLQAIAFVIACLGNRGVRIFATILAKLMLRLGFRQQVVLENLNRAFPELTESERRPLILGQYQNFALLLLEFLRSFYRFGDFLKHNCECEGEENLRTALAKGRGCLVMTAHMGNWEVLPSHGSHVLGYPVTMVTKEIRPRWLQLLVEKTRRRLGVGMAFEPRTMAIVMRALRQNQIVGFAIDQFAGAPVGARVPFFGVPVGTHTALAVLALRTGAPVVPGIVIRRPQGGFLVRFEAPIELPSESDPLTDKSSAEKEVIELTARFNRHVEQWIRAFPTQWLWIHRRWKGDLSPLPVGSVGEMMRPD